MTITTTKVERDIRQLEERLYFLRQLREYLRNGTEPSTNVPTVELETPTDKTLNLGSRVGVRANILRKLAEGAMFPDDIRRWFPPARAHVVTNAIATLRRRNLLRDTAKGRVELTTSGLEEAQWFVTHPTLTKRGKARTAKKATNA